MLALQKPRLSASFPVARMFATHSFCLFLPGEGMITQLPFLCIIKGQDWLMRLHRGNLNMKKGLFSADGRPRTCTFGINSCSMKMGGLPCQVKRVLLITNSRGTSSLACCSRNQKEPCGTLGTCSCIVVSGPLASPTYVSANWLVCL